ncbi:hypothetical protein [Lampropedia aestuarii]|uniref:hypothetical protein n=1 Tax=Lampropedia aestuarii TaxID=2562762 RepID=UPI0014562150|nr:hypothetical protein [Lampropedia aestuarii]
MPGHFVAKLDMCRPSTWDKSVLVKCGVASLNAWARAAQRHGTAVIDFQAHTLTVILVGMLAIAMNSAEGAWERSH